jgi:hypothetical protein
MEHDFDPFEFSGHGGTDPGRFRIVDAERVKVSG